MAKATIIRHKPPTFEKMMLELMAALGLNSKQALFQKLVADAHKKIK